ncbi:hypothetical protein DL768_005756 [Monosporascus sp. mg162]|nr:hypothetical protein DL768_005756 [Monosporascus sp. mg162]
MASFNLVALLAPQQLLPSVAAAAGELRDDTVVAGAYIVEFEADSFYGELKTLSISAKSRVDLNSKLFRGVSFDLSVDSGSVDEEAEKTSQLAMIKNIWPIHQHSAPVVDVLWTGNDTDLPPTVHKRDGKYTEAYDSHLMTQIDKLKRATPAAWLASALASLVTGSEMMPLPETGPSPRDFSGHGTHVADIIAAQDTKYGFTGAATDNNGRFGLFDTFAPASGKGAAAVAAFDNTEILDVRNVATYTVDDGTTGEFEWVVGHAGQWSNNSLALFANSYTDRCLEARDFPDDMENPPFVWPDTGRCGWSDLQAALRAGNRRSMAYADNLSSALSSTSLGEGANGRFPIAAGQELEKLFRSGAIVVVSISDDPSTQYLISEDNYGGYVSTISSWDLLGNSTLSLNSELRATRSPLSIPAPKAITLS